MTAEEATHLSIEGKKKFKKDQYEIAISKMYEWINHATNEGEESVQFCGMDYDADRRKWFYVDGVEDQLKKDGFFVSHFASVGSSWPESHITIISWGQEASKVAERKRLQDIENDNLGSKSYESISAATHQKKS